MKTNTLRSEHWLDSSGNPAGGVAEARGFHISWQNGPLGRGEARREPNGAFVEDVIAAAMDRINFYQSAADARFACPENAEAIAHLQRALAVLNERTKSREARAVEGTHAA